MVDLASRPTVGPYVLTRRLSAHRHAQRWLALHRTNQTSHLSFRFPVFHGRTEQRRFVEAAGLISKLDHPHILEVQEYALDESGAGWIISPFHGDVDGVCPLERLLRDKGGRLEPMEARRAITQLLECVEYAHSQRLVHGPITIEELVVTRQGSVQFELYAMHRLLDGLEPRGNSELIRDEVRSVVEIGYRLLTGLVAEEPLIPAPRLVKKLDPVVERWLDDGLDASGGFASAREAIDALAPARRAEPRTPATLGGRGWRRLGG